MVAIGGLIARAPAQAGTLRGALARTTTALGATILIVQIFTVAAAGLAWAGGILLGFPAWLVIALEAVIGAVSLALCVTVFARALRVERHLADGGDVPIP